MARVTVFAFHKDGETLAALLNQEEFMGVLVRDNAAVCQGFDRAQKCGAHGSHFGWPLYCWSDIKHLLLSC